MKPVASPQWTRLAVQVDGALLEPALALLHPCCAAGVEVVDHDHPQPPAGLPEGWSELRASFPGERPPAGLVENLQRQLRQVADGLPGRPGFRMLPASRHREEDWAAGWRRFFQPVRVGRFYVHPGWQQPPAGERFPVRIDPGQAFGTGLHATTRLCLEQIDRLLPCESLLDLGCGTGILAIAAARAGCRRVLALDADPLACAETGKNAALNGVAERIEIVEADISRARAGFELVVANILSSVLCRHAALLAGLPRPGGRLLLSGILVEEQDRVAAAFTGQGLAAGDRHHLEDWCLLEFRRRGGEAR